MRWLLACLLHLLLQLGDLRLGLFERNVLHQNGLGEDIKRIWIGAKFFVKQGFGVGIFLLQLGLVNALGERVDELFFLGSHADKPPAAGNGGHGLPLRIETHASRQSCAAWVKYVSEAGLVPCPFKTKWRGVRDVICACRDVKGDGVACANVFRLARDNWCKIACAKAVQRPLECENMRFRYAFLHT